MAIKRLEVSNPKFTPQNTQFVTVHSSHLGRRHDISVYNAHAQGENLPIIILMHGVYGNHWVWMNLGGIHNVYEQVKKAQGLGEFILVMPSDGGLHDGSAYLPTTNQGNYEQWIMDDVLSAVIETVPAASTQSNLYLSGLSMGGYGALRLGIKFADKVTAISAHSSITDIQEINLFTDIEQSLLQCENPEEANINYWLAQNKNKLPPIRFDCGKDDELFQGNLAFEKTLKNMNIAYQFDIFEGGHAWEYWHEHVAKTFTFFDQHEKAFHEK